MNLHLITNPHIPIGTETMDATLYSPNAKTNQLLPAVLFLHGRGSQKSRYTDKAQALAQSGFIVLIYSFRGCGNSDGNLADQTVSMGYQDAVAGYNFLKSQKQVDPHRIGVWGGSFGGYQAALLTQDHPVASLVLSVPAQYLNQEWDTVPELTQAEHQAYREGTDFSDSRATQAIETYTGPLLLIQHELDEICPKVQTDSFFNAATKATPKQKTIIKDAPHALKEEKFLKESEQITTEWFKDTLKP